MKHIDQRRLPRALRYLLPVAYGLLLALPVLAQGPGGGGPGGSPEMQKFREQNKYKFQIYPEHPRRLNYDELQGRIGGYPGGGSYAAFAYNVGYTRAMLQAAMDTV